MHPLLQMRVVETSEGASANKNTPNFILFAFYYALLLKCARVFRYG